MAPVSSVSTTRSQIGGNPKSKEGLATIFYRSELNNHKNVQKY